VRNQQQLIRKHAAPLQMQGIAHCFVLQSSKQSAIKRASQLRLPAAMYISQQMLGKALA
jgi:hypothetical protein